MTVVKILGAGLSGLSAAINLAKVGYNVTVFEKRDDCGKRFHGDLQGLENWSSPLDVKEELQTMNISFNFECTPMQTMYLSDGTDKIHVESTRPIFYLVKRGPIENSLDQGLKQQALTAGVDIQFNTTIKPDDVDIIATGPSLHKITAAAKGIIFETDLENMAVALVNNTISYRGYAYLLIANNYGCISTVSAYHAGDLNTYFKNTCDIFCRLFNTTIKNPKECGGVGSFTIKQRLSHKGTRITGEAAGIQDFLWGFGMRYALGSGYLAAKSIIEGKSYTKLFNERFSHTLKASIVNRFYAEKFDDYGKMLINYAKTLKQGEHIKLLTEAYNLSLFKRFMYPYANLYLRIKHKKFI